MFYLVGILALFMVCSQPLPSLADGVLDHTLIENRDGLPGRREGAGSR